ncbi:hypothetical protein LJC58_03920 [Lachnospiraceae bacterium OttesenSCG-928-D06]|nr:hypothetical protein [Lachnospiraceae bacterium OttesenSCG-928-D06]
MSIISGYQKVKNRILTSSGYQLLSRWTSSESVECNDGNTIETKVGDINGIVTTYNEIKTTTEDSFVPSATAVNEGFNEINRNLEIKNYQLTQAIDPQYVTLTMGNCDIKNNRVVMSGGFTILQTLSVRIGLFYTDKINPLHSYNGEWYPVLAYYYDGTPCPMYRMFGTLYTFDQVYKPGHVIFSCEFDIA